MDLIKKSVTGMKDILPDEMEPKDKALLNAYHKAVRKKLMPFMEGDDISWLKEATREI